MDNITSTTNITEKSYQKIDLHTHTCASGHGTKDSITDLAREAAKRSMEILTMDLPAQGAPASPISAVSFYASEAASALPCAMARRQTYWMLREIWTSPMIFWKSLIIVLSVCIDPSMFPALPLKTQRPTSGLCAIPR